MNILEAVIYDITKDEIFTVSHFKNKSGENVAIFVEDDLMYCKFAKGKHKLINKDYIQEKCTYLGDL